jgi:pSer/pThr/pTyr-binding forkhead associated (FHA) protein
MNRAGVLVCENCGTNLISGERGGVGTRQLGERNNAASGEANSLTSEELQAVQSAGTNVFDDSMVLRLEISGAQSPLLIYPKAETSLGRRDPATGTMPDVDLTTYAGYRMGVSRRHAIIRLNNKRLEIYDLGSSNGTAVNGVRLAPHQPYPLRDGDEISLGKMSLRAIFQSGTRKP